MFLRGDVADERPELERGPQLECRIAEAARDPRRSPQLELAPQVRGQPERVLVEIAQHHPQVALQCGRQREPIVELVVPVDKRLAVVRDDEPRDESIATARRARRASRVAPACESRATRRRPSGHGAGRDAARCGFHNFSTLSSARCELPPASISSGPSACHSISGGSSPRSASVSSQSSAIASSSNVRACLRRGAGLASGADTLAREPVRQRRMIVDDSGSARATRADTARTASFRRRAAERELTTAARIGDIAIKAVADRRQLRGLRRLPRLRRA